jgi:hypothetical protein
MAILLFVAISIETRAQSRSSPNTPAPKIPATSGIVVDALTDRPVGGIDVVLRASLAQDEPLRYENSTTSADGRFRFPARPEPRAAGFLSGIKEISLSVNRVFVSVAQMRALNPLESRRTSDVTWLAQHGTLGDYNHTNNPNSEFQPGRLDNRSYFPVSVQFLRDCNYEWSATCLSLSPNASLRISLIPVLNDLADCGRIADPENQRRCRELNTYRAAFLPGHDRTGARRQEAVRECRSGQRFQAMSGTLAQQCPTACTAAREPDAVPGNGLARERSDSDAGRPLRRGLTKPWLRRSV